MDLAGKKVLVTGAGGFIASHLCEELVKKGASVKAFVRYNSRNDWGKLEELPQDILSHIEVVSGDIQDPFFVDEAVKVVSETLKHANVAKEKAESMAVEIAEGLADKLKLATKDELDVVEKLALIAREKAEALEKRVKALEVEIQKLNKA